MCYHYAIPELELLEKHFGIARRPSTVFKRVYHVSGFDQPLLPVIPNSPPFHIQMFQWGLIPFWVKDTTTANQIQGRTINARAETLYEKPSFRHLIPRKRCLVLANGFFEWRHYRGQKYPYYIQLKSHEPFAFAGLWDTWKDPITKQPVYTFTIITTQANALLAKIHNNRKRMPIILKQSDEQQWLKPELSKADVESILVPYDSILMEAHPVSKLLTTRGVDTNTPQVIAPAQYEELPSLTDGLEQYF